MKNVKLEIISNIALTKDVYKIVLEGDLSEIKNPGEFIEISLPNHFLRRPFSVCDVIGNRLTILYKILGQGTKEMTSLKSYCFDCLVGLGNGFDTLTSKKPLLIGGGIGIAPLYGLAKKFNQLGIRPTILMGFKNESEIYYENEFKKIADVVVLTDDGSYGYRGNVVDYLKTNFIDFDFYYACGPLIMLKNLAHYSEKGFLSLEARMGCGFGACMGCSIQTTKGPRRVCKEGPVFVASEVIFDE